MFDRVIFCLGLIRMFVLFAVVFATVDMALAQENGYRGTLQEQLACTPDVFRLCGSEIPDATRIVVCLRQNIQRLGEPCRAVFEANASTPMPETQNGGPISRSPGRDPRGGATRVQPK